MPTNISAKNEASALALITKNRVVLFSSVEKKNECNSYVCNNEKMAVYRFKYVLADGRRRNFCGRKKWRKCKGSR